MDSTAIQEIRDMAYAESAAKHLGNMVSRSRQVILPSGYSITDLERFKDAPNRFRGQFNTYLTDEFISYVNTYGNGSTAVFIDPENVSAEAIIDMAGVGAEWGEHRATVKLKKSPEYVALLSGAQQNFSQMELIDFIEDWSPNVAFFSADKGVSTSSAISAIRKMAVNTKSESINESGDFNASLSSFDQIEVSAKVGIMPDRFEFRCSPYDALSERPFECRIRATTDEKKVSLKFRIIGIDRVQNEIAIELGNRLMQELTISSSKIHLGDMKYQGK